MFHFSNKTKTKFSQVIFFSKKWPKLCICQHTRLNLKLSSKFLFKNFFYKILKELTKNDHKSLNHIQIHNLGHFLGKNIPWLNLVLVLLLKWSIVPSRNDLKIYYCLGHQTLLCLIESIRLIYLICLILLICLIYLICLILFIRLISLLCLIFLLCLI